MRWNNPDYGKTIRYRRKFLLLPRTFKGETRWLEFATLEEHFTECYTTEVGIGLCSYYDWCEVGFVNNEVSAI